MTTHEIEELLEMYKNDRHTNAREDFKVGWDQGFETAIELMLPLVESLHSKKPYWLFKKDFDKAIQTLVKTLKGEG